ncbi:MAG: ATP-binding protein [Cohaesibacter sp.]|nr:ATP-binding protein [Cohaesibacter sp.]
MSFRLKTIFGIAAIEALLLSILIVSGLHYLTISNQEQLLQRGQSTAKLVATMTADAVIAVDLATLDALVEQTLRNKDIVYLRIRNQNGQTLSQGGDADALAQPFHADASIEAAQSDQRLDVFAPVQIANSDFGRIELGLSTAQLETIISSAFSWMTTIALSEMLLVALAGWILGTYLTAQLQSLKTGAKQVAAGDFGHQIQVKGKDELAQTAKSFNHMSRALKDYADLAEKARLDAEKGRDFAQSTLKDALDNMQDGVVIFDRDENIILMNKAYRDQYDLSDLPVSEVPTTARSLFAAQQICMQETGPDFVDQTLSILRKPAPKTRRECRLHDGRHLLLAHQSMSNGGKVLVQTDVTDLYQALEENRHLQLQVMQQHKTEALGTMANSMAHEINTPAQFISDNITFVANGLQDLCTMMDHLCQQGQSPHGLNIDALNQAMEEADWDFLKTELPQAVTEIQNGTHRIRDQILTFKQFAAHESDTRELVNLKDAIETTLHISKSQWQSKTKIDILVPTNHPLPKVSCQRAQINQVIQHLLSNALHAIEDAKRQEGEITMKLDSDQDHITLSVQDNGCGMSKTQLGKIFDVFYTSKAPGRGTGHGLALCHSIIVDSHGGTLSVSSQEGKGSCFTLTLPLARLTKVA